MDTVKHLNELIADLDDIARDAGDNRDRSGEYTSDRIRVITNKLRRIREDLS